MSCHRRGQENLFVPMRKQALFFLFFNCSRDHQKKCDGLFLVVTCSSLIEEEQVQVASLQATCKNCIPFLTLQFLSRDMIQVLIRIHVFLGS